MPGVAGPVPLVEAVVAAWQAAAPAGTVVEAGALPEVLPSRLCSVAVGDFDDGGVSVEPEIDDFSGGYLSVFIIRCLVTVWDSARDWRTPTTAAQDLVSALRQAIAADMTLAGVAVEAALTGDQQWHIDTHAPDGGSAGVELAVRVVAQET